MKFNPEIEADHSRRFVVGLVGSRRAGLDCREQRKLGRQTWARGPRCSWVAHVIEVCFYFFSVSVKKVFALLRGVRQAVEHTGWLVECCCLDLVRGVQGERKRRTSMKRVSLYLFAYAHHRASLLDTYHFFFKPISSQSLLSPLKPQT